MSIRTKIIFIVLPLIASALLITGAISSLSARSGMTRIAMESLGFKSQELKKYAQNQWNLLTSNNLDQRPEYVEVAQSAFASYSKSIISTRTELIFAINQDISIVMSTENMELSVDEKLVLRNLFKTKQEGWIELKAGGKERVGSAFFFEPFQWYSLITEDKAAFYKEVSQIFNQSIIILSASLLITIILLLLFSGYLTGPLRRVGGAMRAIISDNDMSRRVEVEFPDEIGELAHTFNIMVGQLEKAYGQIKNFAFDAVMAQKNEHKIRNIFQKYVPKDIIDSLFMHPEKMLIGDNRVLAILFSDIRSFTTISEGFMPDELVVALNKYFELLVDIIMKHDGIVDKYIGDAIMAFFGAPVKHENDAEQAVRAGLEMQIAIKNFNKAQAQQGKPEFRTGVGINYGVVTVGNIGSEKKMDYTIIGDMVNLGSRLEGLTKVYHQELIFSESVYRKVKGALPCRMIDKVVVKGKTQGEKIFTAKLKIAESEKKAWTFYHTGLRIYYSRQFSKAITLFQAALEILPQDYLAQLYIDRCRNYLRKPPPSEWEGQEILKEK